MSRRHRAEKRQVVPDARYKSPLVAHLVNVIMKSGKRTLAERIVYGAFEKVSEKLQKGDPVDLLLAVGADMEIARLDGMTAVHLAQLPGTPKVIYDLMMLGQEENHE